MVSYMKTHLVVGIPGCCEVTMTEPWSFFVVALGASASIDGHVRQESVDDFPSVVIVEKLHRRKSRRRTAKTAGRQHAAIIRLQNDVAVLVSLEKNLGAGAGAEIGLVLLRRQDPVPAESVEVDG